MPTISSSDPSTGSTLRGPLIAAKAEQLRNQLDALGADELQALVQHARLSDAWPNERYVRWHARKHGEGRSGDQYVAWAQAIKNRPGTEVYAYVHSDMTCGFAFINRREDAVVWFSLDEDQNMSVFHPDEGVSRFLDRKTTYWRLRETEL